MAEHAHQRINLNQFVLEPHDLADPFALWSRRVLGEFVALFCRPPSAGLVVLEASWITELRALLRSAVPVKCEMCDDAGRLSDDVFCTCDFGEK
jgi:hypothetical protein